MNIVLFSPSWPPAGSSNGIVTYCAELKKGLENLGHNIHIVYGELNGAFDEYSEGTRAEYKLSLIEKLYLKVIDLFDQSYRIYYVQSRGIFNAIRELEIKQKIDILEIEESFGTHQFLQKKCDFPIVLRFHGPHFINSKYELDPNLIDKGRLKRERHSAKKAKYVSSPSKYVLEEVINEYKPEWNKYKVIPNPINEPDAENIWNKNTYKKHQLLYVGRFDYHKGGDLVIKAFQIIHKRYPDAKLLFVGPDSGVSIDGSIIYIKEFIEKYFSEEDQESIQFLGRKDPHEIVGFRKDSHITVAASLHENFSYVSLEALAAGSPFVCSGVGGNKELIQSGVNGYLFDNFDFEGLAEIVCKLFEDEKKLNDIAANGVKTIRKSYNSQHISQLTNEFYSQICNNIN